MPAGTMDTTDTLALLKRVFIKDAEVIDQLEEGTPLLDLTEHGSDVTEAVKIMGRHEGEFMVIPVRTGNNPNRAVPLRTQTQAHPQAGSNKYDRLKYVMAEMSETIEVAALAALTAQGNPQSVDDALALEADGMISGCRKRMSQLMHGDASAMWTSVPASTSWDDTTKKLTVVDVTWAEVGMEIVARHKTTGALPATWPVTLLATGEPLVISAIDTANKTLTLTKYDGTAVSMTAAQLNAQGVYPHDSQGKAIWGLGNACATSDPSTHGYDPSALTPAEDVATAQKFFGGIKRSVAGNEWWKGASLTATALGGTDTLSIRKHLAPLLHRIHKRTGGANGWLLGVTGFDAQQQIVDDLSRNQRTNFTYELEGGYEAVKYGELYTVVDQDADYTQLKVFEPDATFMVIGEDWHFDDTTGAMWNRKFNTLGRGMDVFSAYFLTRRQWCWGSCKTASAITSINATI